MKLLFIIIGQGFGGMWAATCILVGTPAHAFRGFSGLRSDAGSGTESQTLISKIALVVLAGSAISLCIAWRAGRPKPIWNPLETVGQAAAEETATLLGNHGRIVVIAPDYILPSDLTEVFAKAIS